MEDVQLELVNEDEEEEGTKNTPLRYTKGDRLPVRVMGSIHTPLETTIEEGLDP
jgi:hypothetical protein